MVKLKIIVEKGEQGGYVAHCPELKGCWTQGDTLEELVKNIAEAVSGCVEARIATAFKNDVEKKGEIIKGHRTPVTITV